MHLGSLAGHEIGLNLPYAISLSCINTGVVHITAPDIFTKIQCNNSQFICLFCVLCKDRALKALWSFIWFIGVHQWSDILRFLIKVGILNTLKIWKKKTLCVTEQKKTTQQFHRRIDPNVMDCLFSSWNSAKKKKILHKIYRVLQGILNQVYFFVFGPRKSLVKLAYNFFVKFLSTKKDIRLM